MEIVSRLAWSDVAWGTPLVQAFVERRLPAEWLGPPPGTFASPAGCSDMAAKFHAELLDEMPAERRAAWAPLAEAGARAVVTGQQPGCVGGALLVLYKAATAVALAGRATATLGRAVVPVYWNASDDEDFDEVARVGWPAGGRDLEYLELPRAGLRPGGWVGDLPAAGDRAAAEHVLRSLDAPQHAALAGFLPAAAADHGAWVGALLGAVFPELAILDARSAALRRAGAPLFARYLSQRDAAVRVLRQAGEKVSAAGFTPVLAPETATRGLYLTPERHRQKPGADVQPLVRAVAATPEHVSPNVVLRPLLQDSALPVIAHVVGPSEVAYLLELGGLRELLQVPVPALVVRATCTLAEAAGWSRAHALGLDPRALVRDPEAALVDLARSGMPRAALSEAFAGLGGSLQAMPFTAAARARAARRLGALQEDLEQDLAAAARAALVQAHPDLGRLPGLLRPRAHPQERLVAGLWALAHWGAAARASLLQLAGMHLDALAAGRGEHLLATL